MSNITDKQSGETFFGVDDEGIIYFIGNDMAEQGEDYDPKKTRENLLTALRYDQKNRIARADQKDARRKTQEEFRRMNAEARAIRGDTKESGGIDWFSVIMSIIAIALLAIARGLGAF